MFDDFSDDYGEGPYSGYDYSLPEDFNLDIGSLGSNAELGLNFDWGDLSKLAADPNLFAAFAEANPEDAALLRDLMGGDYGFAPVGSDNPVDAYERGSGEFLGENIKSGVKEWDKAATDAGLELIDPNAKTTSTTTDKKGILGTDITATDAAKYAAMLAMAKMAYEDAQKSREEARGWSAPGGYSKQAVRSPGGGVSFKKSGKAMGGGIGSLDMAQGGRALPPRYLDGHSDGMADKVPAHIDNKRPAALSDGEFVIPADVVSHLGNGNSNAGAKRLYKMMDDIRAARTGNPKQGKQINPDKFMPR